MRKSIIFFICSMILLTGVSYAQQKQIKKPALNNTTLLKKVSFNIAVTDILADNGCFLKVKFQNKGKTRIHTKLHFKLWINGLLVRDKDMLFDDFKPGISRSHGYTGVKPIRILRSSVIKAFVDTTNKLKESRSTRPNNSMKKKVACRNTNILIKK